MLGSFTLRRVRSAWLLVGCLTATVLVATALVSALASFYTVALPAAVTSELPRSGPMAVVVYGVTGGGESAAGVARRLSAEITVVPARVYPATWSADLAVPGPPQDGQQPLIQAASVTGITANARLTAGRWPAAPHAGQPIPAALPTAAATDLGLRVGSVLTVADPATGYQTTMQVSGLYRPSRPAAPYWQFDTIGPTGVADDSGLIYGPAVVSPAAFGGEASGMLNPSQLTVVALPRVASIRTADLSPLASEISRAASAIDNSGYLAASTDMPRLLADALAGLATARSLVLISGLQLLLLACAALGLASRLLASYREEETALLAARGAARRQLIRQSLAEAAIAVGLSAAVGTVAGSWLSAALLSHLTGLPAQRPVPGTAAWLAAAVLAVVCLGIVVWPTLRPPRPGDVRIRRGRSAQLAVAISAGADIALIALALLAVRELRSYSATAQVATGSGLDPVIAVAPALALAGFAIVPLRLLPIAARGLERLTARGSRFGSAMANWEISRRPLRQSGPALLVILAVGTSTLGLAQYQSWRQSLHDQAAFATGAQVSVNVPLFAPAADGTRMARLPGVTSAMPVSAVPQSGSGQLVVLDAALAARTVTLRPDLSSLPAGQLFATITTRSRPGVVLPGRPAQIALTASLAAGPASAAPAGLGPVSATLTVQDAYGVSYAIQTSAIPADGRSHELVAGLRAAGTGYPLRLIGIAVSYNMPAYPLTVQAERADQSAVLQLDSIAVSPSVTRPFPRPFATGRAVAAWPAQTADPGLGFELSLLNGVASGSVKPEIGSKATAGGAELIRFEPGHGPLLPQPPPGTSATPQPGPADVDIDIPPASRPVPVITTARYAATNGLHDGSVLAVTIAGQQVSCQLVATVKAFPGGGVLVADQVAVQDALANLGFGGSLRVSAWWLATATGAAPADGPAGWTVTDTDALAGRLESDPLSAAPVHAAAAVAVGVALLAALGFCVSVAASARERRSQHALLAALGVPATAQARLFCLEEALISIPATAVGLVIGVVLARVMVPSLTVTATGGQPLLPVLVTLPLGWLLPLAAALAVVPVVAAAVTALRQPDPAAELRAAEAIA
ncbi:MAG: FtsX-like permease family protein [Streptosporangiaceae bacterium]